MWKMRTGHLKSTSLKRVRCWLQPPHEAPVENQDQLDNSEFSSRAFPSPVFPFPGPFVHVHYAGQNSPQITFNYSESPKPKKESTWNQFNFYNINDNKYWQNHKHECLMFVGETFCWLFARKRQICKSRGFTLGGAWFVVQSLTFSQPCK